MRLSRCAHGSASLRPTHSTGQADVERLSDERVQCDPRGHDVATCVFPGELNLLEDLRLDQSQLVAATRRAERSFTVRVPIAFETSAGQRHCSVDTQERSLGGGSDENPGDRSDAGGSTVRRLRREMQIERRHHPTQPRSLRRPARRMGRAKRPTVSRTSRLRADHPRARSTGLPSRTTRASRWERARDYAQRATAERSPAARRRAGAPGRLFGALPPDTHGDRRRAPRPDRSARIGASSGG